MEERLAGIGNIVNYYKESSENIIHSFEIDSESLQSFGSDMYNYSYHFKLVYSNQQNPEDKLELEAFDSFTIRRRTQKTGLQILFAVV